MDSEWMIPVCNFTMFYNNDILSYCACVWVGVFVCVCMAVEM
jgi:hypothetical protein